MEKKPIESFYPNVFRRKTAGYQIVRTPLLASFYICLTLDLYLCSAKKMVGMFR